VRVKKTREDQQENNDGTDGMLSEYEPKVQVKHHITAGSDGSSSLCTSSSHPGPAANQPWGEKSTEASKTTQNRGSDRREERRKKKQAAAAAETNG